MVIKLIFWFLLAKFSQSEYTSGLWRNEERRYDRRNNFNNNEDIYTRDYRVTQSYGKNYLSDERYENDYLGSRRTTQRYEKNYLQDGRIDQRDENDYLGDYRTTPSYRKIYTNNQNNQNYEKNYLRDDKTNLKQENDYLTDYRTVRGYRKNYQRDDRINRNYERNYPEDGIIFSNEDNHPREDETNQMYKNNYPRDVLTTQRYENDFLEDLRTTQSYEKNYLREVETAQSNNNDYVVNFLSNDESNKMKVQKNDTEVQQQDTPPRPRQPAKERNSNSNLISIKKCGLDVPRRIIGGTNTDIDEFPWLVLLQYVDPKGKVSHDCSGVLISKRYVLTAAHCTHGLGITTRRMKLRKVRLGEWDTSSDKDCQGDVCSSPIQEIDVEEAIPHENYKSKDKAQVNDIALIRLRDEANLNQFVQPICLPFASIGNTDYEGKKLTVSGWGRTSNARDSSSSIKMKVDLPVVNKNSCRQFYKSFYGDLNIAESQFCAGGEEGKDSCQGDSGGPLMTTERTENEMKWYVIGIVSSGPAACGVQDRPSLYTNVSQFTDWISENVKN